VTSRNTRYALLHAALAGAGAAAVAWLGPPGADLAAHVYQRALFLQHGFELWNNYWYAGRYSFVTYSLIYYPLAALVGIKVLAVGTAALGAAAFSSLVDSEWPSAGPWPARAFTAVAAASVVTGAYPYALGLACALLALRALRPYRLPTFAACVGLTFAASPLAFGLLVIVLVSVAAMNRGPKLIAPAFAVALPGTAAVVLWRLFPDSGRFPFSIAELAATMTFCLLGVAFTWHVAAARVLNRFFALYAVAAIAAFALPSALGENIARLRFVALPIAVLAVALRRWQPVVPVTVAVLLAASWNVTPLAFSFAHEVQDPSGNAAYWAPVVDYLSGRLQPSYRVEAVDTVGHWEAVYLPQHRIPIVRGWFRQDDFPQNELLYDGTLRATSYRSWLRRMGVAYVVLTDAPVDYSARSEAALLESGRSGLPEIYATAHATIYAVPDPQGIVVGASGAHVVKLGPSSMTVALSHAGVYRIAVRYSPYWHATSGCVTKRKDGMTSLRVTRRGWVRFSFDVTPRRAVDAGIGAAPTCQGPSTRSSGASATSTVPSARRSTRNG
jgi:hypothetical protein